MCQFAVRADLVYNENRGKIRKNEKENSSLFENDYETAHEAYYRVTKDWYSVLATALKDKFKDTDVLRNYIQSMQGKAIVGPSISESYSLPVALTNILNYAANSDNSVAALEDVVNGLDINYDAVDVEVNEKLLRNRFTKVFFAYF